jgi:hypothetical protein
MNQPYTHAMHAHKCGEAGRSGVVLSAQPVQVRKNGVIYCARIANAWTAPNGLDCWTVESSLPEVARFTVPVRQVRECGQVDCSCAPTAAGVDRAKLAPHVSLAQAAAETGIRG